MSYTLQAIVSRGGTFPKQLPDGVRVVALAQGIEMIPLDVSTRACLDIAFLPLTDDGLTELPTTLVGLCAQLSLNGDVAYIEAEFFGGDGGQAHALFRHGNSMGPVNSSGHAINAALKWIGVNSSTALDEFDEVGLGRHRDTNDWTS